MKESALSNHFVAMIPCHQIPQAAAVFFAAGNYLFQSFVALCGWESISEQNLYTIRNFSTLVLPFVNAQHQISEGWHLLQN